jgi:hypothetical protein
MPLNVVRGRGGIVGRIVGRCFVGILSWAGEVPHSVAALFADDAQYWAVTHTFYTVVGSLGALLGVFGCSVVPSTYVAAYGFLGELAVWARVAQLVTA